MKKYLLAAAFMAAQPLCLISSQAVEIGVQAIVDTDQITPQMSEADWLDFLDQLYFESNDMYAESGVDIQLRLTDLTFIDTAFAERQSSSGVGAILDEVSREDGIYTEVLRNADRTGSDYIMFFDDLEDANLCGRAINVNTSRGAISRTAASIAVSDPDCGAEVFLHELGHLMGLAHGNQVATARGSNVHLPAITSYARGFGRIVNLVSADDTFEDERAEPGEYGTIMVSNNLKFWARGGGVKLPIFSSPNNTFFTVCNGPCGDVNTGDAARALNENRFIYAAHESTDVAELKYADPALTTCIGQSHGDTEIDELFDLNCASRGIRSVEGIEQLADIQFLNLQNNNIQNLLPLIALDTPTDLVQLINLSGNDAAICSQLRVLQERFPGQVSPPNKCFNLSAVLVAVTGVL